MFRAPNQMHPSATSTLCRYPHYSHAPICYAPSTPCKCQCCLWLIPSDTRWVRQDPSSTNRGTHQDTRTHIHTYIHTPIASMHNTPTATIDCIPLISLAPALQSLFAIPARNATYPRPTCLRQNIQHQQPQPLERAAGISLLH
jgi:hypothetical protein